MNIRRPGIGFPKMNEEAEERRAFLPHFIQQLVKIGFEVYLEKGYGLAIEQTFEDYQSENSHVHAVNRSQAFKKDYVLILRSPAMAEFDLIGRKSCLISMLHFPTRPIRNQALKSKNIHAISLDGIVDDFNIRLVENMKAVAWNGLEAVFGELLHSYPHLIRSDGQPWQILILGTGMVGKQAVDAANKFGRREWNQEHIQNGGKGTLITSVGRNVTCQKELMLAMLRRSHVIVDCTQRKDASRPVIPNDWLAECQPDAVLADLSVDPYTLEAAPPVVKGIEGIPHGNLNHYVFNPNDPDWDKTVPSAIPSRNRRKVISCYSWPGIYPKRCMHVYGQQLLPLMRVLARKNYNSLSPDGPHFERALYRARLDTFLEHSRRDPVE